MEENITNPSCNTWQPIVTYVLIFLNIMISIGKQFLNNNKHIKLNSNVDTILTGIKRNNQNTNIHYPTPLNTEVEDLINLNIPEHLKTSQRNKIQLQFFPYQIFFSFYENKPK